MLSGEKLTTNGKLRDADFQLWPGKTLGIAGLQGMGQQDRFHACFGITPLKSGTIKLDGKPVTLTSPKDAIRPNIGISLAPEERKIEGLFLGCDGSFNVSLPMLDRFSRMGLVDRKVEQDVVSRVLDRSKLIRALYTKAGAFSGGNQQKGAALVYSNGTPSGLVSPGMRWFMTGRLLGVTPVVFLIAGFVAVAVVLLGRSVFGRTPPAACAITPRAIRGFMPPSSTAPSAGLIGLAR